MRGSMKKIAIFCLSVILVNFITGCTLNINMNSPKQNDPNNETAIEKPTLNQEELNMIEQQGVKKGMDTNVSTNNSLIVPSAIKLNNDEEVIAYFNTVNDQVDYFASQPKSETIKEKLANTFITIVDFLFYDGTIGGVTFNQLTDAAKEKVLAIAKVIDEKIEKYFPGYKEKIKDTATRIYSSASEKIKEGLQKGKDFIKDHIGDENYEQLQEDGSNLVDSFKNAGSVIKDVFTKGKDKVKDWYESFRDKYKSE